MLIDQVTIKIKAGDGGDGNVHFYRDRYQPKGGPDGGEGGSGGSVYFLAGSDINLLRQFRHQKNFSASHGQKGGVNQKSGKSGNDLILKVPVGTIIMVNGKVITELTSPGQEVLVDKGGRGGRGNYSFRSSTNTTPLESQPGQIIEIKEVFLQLKLIAHVGLVGLPNAGKTSLLNQLTASQAKVASYAFTTLEPNLGVTQSRHIIADIPGLIQGAAAGKGLGHKFLKHLERTKLLVHCLSSESSHPSKDYKTIRSEIKKFNPSLSKKPQILIITK